MVGIRSFVVAMLWLWPVVAVAWSPFPQPGAAGRLAVDPALDGPQWDRTRTCLSNLSSRVDATYYAAVVPITDRAGNATPQANDAVPFVDALALQWQGLEPKRHVLIALGLNNRAVAIHPGSSWAGIGFERGVITNTIDGSSFKSFARAGDYPEAVCSLAKSVDEQLAHLQGAVAETRRRAGVKLDALRDDFAQVAPLTARAQKLDPLFGTWVRGELGSAQQRANAARELIDHSPPQAEAGANAARRTFDEAASDIDRYEQFVRRTPEWQERIDSTRTAIESRPDADWTSPQRALEQLAKCAYLIDEFNVLSGGPGPAGIDRCLSQIDGHLEAADSQYFVLRTVMPLTIAGAAVLVVIVLFIVLAVRRRRMMKLVETELARWSKALGAASDRLLDLEREFSLYFDSGRAAWSGESAELDQQCADEVNRLFLMFAKAQDIYNAAKQATDDAPVLRVTALERVLERLHTAKITIEMGERETQRRIFLPLSREYTASAAKLLEDLAGTYTRAVELLQAATSLIERVDTLRVEVADLSADAERGVRARTDAGLPTEHLEQHARQGDADRLAGRSIAANDPKQAVDYFVQARDHLHECLRLTELGNEAMVGVRETLPARRDTISQRVAALRSDGFAVLEPGFDPEHELERLTRVGSTVLQQLREPDDERAGATWRAIVTDLDNLDHGIELTERAREGVPRRLAELESQHRQNDGRVPDATRILKQLQTAHATAAYERESDNVDEIAALRDVVITGFESARAAHATQHYLAARSDVETLAQAIAHREALLDELETILERLEIARKQAAELFGKAAKTLSETQSLCRSERGVTDELANSVQETLSALSVARKLAADPRPHWLELRAEAERLNATANAQREETAAEVAAYRVARTEYRQLDKQCSELIKRARLETRDRPHVEAMLIDAKKAIESAAAFTEKPGASGTRAMLEVDTAAKWLDRGRKAWKSELQAFQSAEADLTNALHRYERVHGASYGYGAFADASGAQQHMTGAQRAAERREWEKVAQLAGAALVAIGAAEDYAQDQADRERRRREEEARRARAVAASSSFSSSSSSFSSSSSSSSSSSFSSSSFSSSSSSGGSSFSSSSGGSSW